MGGWETRRATPPHPGHIRGGSSSLLHPGHIGAREEPGCQWRLWDCGPVVTGSWLVCFCFVLFFFEAQFLLSLATFREDGGGGGAARPSLHPAGLGRLGGLGPFPGVQPRGSGRRGAPTVPGSPGSPRPAPRRGPRPAPLRPPPAGRAETRARGGGPRGGGGRGAAPTLAGSRAMAGEGGARGAGGRAGRPRPRWTEPPGSQLPPAERGRPFSAARFIGFFFFS